MRYHAFLKHESLEHVHDVMLSLDSHIQDYTFVEMSTGYVAIMVRYTRTDAPEALAAAGVMTWPHIIEHDMTLDDSQHQGIVPAEAGIASGDTALQAARKLYAHLGNHAPFRPVLIF